MLQVCFARNIANNIPEFVNDRLILNYWTVWAETQVHSSVSNKHERQLCFSMQQPWGNYSVIVFIMFCIGVNVSAFRKEEKINGDFISNETGPHGTGVSHLYLMIWEMSHIHTSVNYCTNMSEYKSLASLRLFSLPCTVKKS